MYLLILILPLLGSLSAGLLGRWLGYFGAPLLTVVLMGTTLLLVLCGYYEIIFFQSPLVLPMSFSWITLGWLDLEMGFLFDELSISMMIPICIVSFLVHMYAIGYMTGDPHLQRFFSYLSLFTFFMLMMVTADNWLLLFIGWEGVGLVSYLLIGFWFTRLRAGQAALKAFLMNRVGDTGLFLAMALAIWLTGDLEFQTLLALLPYLNPNWTTLLGLLILMAVIAKSGQLGLHAWLPEAMEGPTPVSALIHAATMVTAGIYLLLRFNALFGFSPVLIWLGAATALFGAVYGYVQTDMKRTIAYSTTSQLGYMVLACGLGQYGLALAHLVNHAFFKALLFLSAGAVIHAIHDEQDIRKMGGLMKLMPITYVTSMVGSLSLVALPFLTGYFSKDYILQTAFGTTGYMLGLAAAYFTAFYSLKLLHRVFWLPPQSKIVLNAHEPSAWILVPTVFLTIASVAWGYMAQYHAALMPGMNAFYLMPQNQIGFGHLPWWVDWLPLLALLIAPLAIHPRLAFNMPTLKFNLFPFMQLGNMTSRYLDNGWFGYLGPQGAVLGLNKVAGSLDLLSTRYLPHLFLIPVALLMILSL
jgi:NADH-ubiquinone oxidoreductase chain 5